MYTSSPSRRPNPSNVSLSRAGHLDASASQWDRQNSRNPNIDTNSGETPREIIVGVDYGTTFTSISYHILSDEDDHTRVFPHEVGVISEWPHDGFDGSKMHIPTETWYSSVPKIRGRPVGQFELSNSDSESTSSDDEDLRASRSSSSDPGQGGDDLARLFWGYEVPYKKYVELAPRSEHRRIEHVKSMLLRAEYAHDDQREIRPRIDRLIAEKIIRKFGTTDVPESQDAQDLITDFLVPVLRHTRHQLIKHEGLTDQCSISFVLTVPLIWDATSLRILQTAMEAAIRETKFGTLRHGSVDNLFIISEPEAAATYLLGTSDDMLAGETFTVLDCGGGTVDGTTYMVTNSYPLSLGAEVGHPGGDNCGASYLNKNYANLLLERLAEETYLEDNGRTLEAIVQGTIFTFENFVKRSIDVTKNLSGRVKIDGLRGDRQRGLVGAAAKGFEDNVLILSPADYAAIFLPLLKRVAKVLEGQLEGAMMKGQQVKRVYLIGGFGAAPSLRSYLKNFLVQYAKKVNLSYPIQLILSNKKTCVTAVSSGSVLRGANLDGGPEREAYSSYGFLRNELYDPEQFMGHRNAETFIDPCDGEQYVKVIHYFIHHGAVLPPMHTYRPLKSVHAFPIDSERLLCDEYLYVNDKPTASSYPLDHEYNNGARIVGKLVSDMTFLRDDRLIRRRAPRLDADGMKQGMAHYVVTFDLVAIIECRNLRYEARYPANNSGKVQKTDQVCIAAAFKPGTG
ncbi:hypothetical protein BGZ57DRAFT_835412 [Hyaloscypha finlandica]|nr:hypothetical protein BGZ57DRAFT_835412 [Hyaloscypha finlandica]